MHKTKRGFTIVELLIVIVVIGILAAITIVAYNGFQNRATDSRRQSDISTIIKAANLYYADKGMYPPTGGSTAIDASWSTTADASWATFSSQLTPYISTMPRDPVSTPNQSFVVSGVYNYSTLKTSAAWTCNGKESFVITWSYVQGANPRTIPSGCNDVNWGATVSVYILVAS